MFSNILKNKATESQGEAEAEAKQTLTPDQNGEAAEQGDKTGEVSQEAVSTDSSGTVDPEAKAGAEGAGNEPLVSAVEELQGGGSGDQNSSGAGDQGDSGAAGDNSGDAGGPTDQEKETGDIIKSEQAHSDDFAFDPKKEVKFEKAPVNEDGSSVGSDTGADSVIGDATSVRLITKEAVLSAIKQETHVQINGEQSEALQHLFEVPEDKEAPDVLDWKDVQSTLMATRETSLLNQSQYLAVRNAVFAKSYLETDA